MAVSSSAMAGIAASQAAIAAANAERAGVAQCKVVVGGFDSTTCTVEQAKEYAYCINKLYPSEASGVEVLAIKTLIVLAIIGAVIGFFYARRTNLVDWMDYILLPLAGAVLLPTAGAILGVAVIGIRFLFS